MGGCTKCLRLKDTDQDPAVPNKVQRPISTRQSRASQSRHLSESVSPSRKHRVKKKLSFSLNKKVTDALTAEVIQRPKSEKERQQIRDCLLRHFVFSSLADENIEDVIDEMVLYCLDPDQVVFQQGDPGFNFFVIDSGQVEVLVNSQVKSVLSKGASFGELALMHNSNRTATIRTVCNCMLWGIDRLTFREAVHSVTLRKFQENKAFVDNVPLFKPLTSAQKELLLSLMITQDFAQGQEIVKEGDPGDMFYIIKDGQVKCTLMGRFIRSMGKGEFFGEQALLYNIERTASVSAVGRATVLSLGSESLVKVLGDKLQSIIYKNTQMFALEKVHALRSLSQVQLGAIIEAMKVETFGPGEVVIRAGTPKGTHLWVVLKGTIQCAEGRHTVGDHIFSAEQGKNFTSDFQATKDCLISAIAIKDLQICLGGSLDVVSTHNKIITVLRNVELLRCLPLHKLEQLCGLLRLKSYANGGVVFREGTPGDEFFIVKSGVVAVMKNGVCLRSIGKYDYFGQRSILLNQNRTATVIAQSEVESWVLSRSDFLDLVKEGIYSQLLKRIDLQDDQIALQDLKIQKLLGKGMFGNVFLARFKQSKYALKAVSRAKVGIYDLQESLMLERNILLRLNHPFIMKLVKTFKDKERLYFLMEFVKGQDLFDVMRILDIVSNDDSRFYMSSVVLILEHLHGNMVIYRDLKPENIIVDEDGYIKLIDFGSSKILQGRTNTIVGTPFYMAPEVIMGRGYGLTADYWSMGVLLYELLCGFVPFGEDEEEPCRIYERVVQSKLKFPGTLNADESAKDLIKQLLDHNPAMRGSIGSIKGHSWFEGVDFDVLLGKEYKAPYVPKMEDLEDGSQAGLDVIGKEEQADFEEIRHMKPRRSSQGWDMDF